MPSPRCDSRGAAVHRGLSRRSSLSHVCYRLKKLNLGVRQGFPDARRFEGWLPPRSPATNLTAAMVVRHGHLAEPSDADYLCNMATSDIGISTAKKSMAAPIITAHTTIRKMSAAILISTGCTICPTPAYASPRTKSFYPSGKFVMREDEVRPQRAAAHAARKFRLSPN